MKRTCSDCKALRTGSNNSATWCELGHKIKEIHGKTTAGDVYVPCPAEECEKPKTNIELCNCGQTQRKEY